MPANGKKEERKEEVGGRGGAGLQCCLGLFGQSVGALHIFSQIQKILWSNSENSRLVVWPGAGIIRSSGLGSRNSGGGAWEQRGVASLLKGWSLLGVGRRLQQPFPTSVPWQIAVPREFGREFTSRVFGAWGSAGCLANSQKADGVPWPV